MSDRQGVRILVVEDEADQRRLVAALLAKEGYVAAEAGSLAEARAELARSPVDLVVCDHRLPDGEGSELLAELRRGGDGGSVGAAGSELSPGGPGFLVVTAYGTIARAVAALRAGADDYLAKPFEAQALVLAVERVLRSRRLAAENRRLAEALGERDRLVELVGRAPAMQHLFRRIQKVAGTDAVVLLTGESGTGKELAARALHSLSLRAAGPFTAVNCAAVPEGLIEAEFFGAEKGAYTGADRRRQGKFQAAEGGTLFLDEVGELPLSVQPKLLRALQEGRVARVGEARETPFDARIVAATNRDLSAEVAAGRFREDLFYRLNVVPIELPPLRERREDLPVLVEHLAGRVLRRHGLRVEGFGRRVMRLLMDYTWPGNVRELANVVERLILLADDGRVREEDLPPQIRGGGGGGVRGTAGFELPPGGMSWEAHEASCLAQALELAGGNRARAARLLDLPYKAFLYRLEKHGLAEA